MGAQKNDEIEIDLGELFLNIVSHWAAINPALHCTSGDSRLFLWQIYDDTTVFFNICPLCP